MAVGADKPALLVAEPAALKGAADSPKLGSALASEGAAPVLGPADLSKAD